MSPCSALIVHVTYAHSHRMRAFRTKRGGRHVMQLRTKAFEACRQETDTSADFEREVSASFVDSGLGIIFYIVGLHPWPAALSAPVFAAASSLFSSSDAGRPSASKAVTITTVESLRRLGDSNTCVVCVCMKKVTSYTICLTDCLTD